MDEHIREEPETHGGGFQADAWVLDPRLLSPIRGAIKLAASDRKRDAAYEWIEHIERSLERLEIRVEQSRRLANGDLTVEALYRGWLDSLITVQSEERKHVCPVRPAVSGPSRMAVAPVVDLLAGASYAAGGAPELVACYASALRQYLARTAGFVDVLSAVATREPPETLLALLDDDAAGWLATGAESAITAWTDLDPIALWIRATSEEHHNARVLRISPVQVCPSGELTLHADLSRPFEIERPPEIGVFYGRGHDAPIRTWTKTAVTVQLPESVESAFVYFGRHPGSNAKEIEAAVEKLSRRLGEAWPKTYLHYAWPRGAARLPYVHEDRRNWFRVVRPPRVLDFAVWDRTRRRIDSGRIDAGPATLRWEVASDDPSGLMVRLLRAGTQFAERLPAKGSFPLPSTARASYRLDVKDMYGSAHIDIYAEIPESLWLFPNPAWAEVDHPSWLSVSVPPWRRLKEPDIQVTLESSDPDQVVVWPATTIIGVGQSRVDTSLRASGPGHHPSVVATITARAEGYDQATVDVWLANPSGHWDLLEDALGLVAVHAALLENGKVLFFSWDEDDISNLNRGKYQLWDPETSKPGPLRLMSRNLFCAGHCILPDGRLLVVGGRSGGPYWDGRSYGPDVDVHTVQLDPSDPTSVTWVRWDPLQQAHWYPTCVTLPDGMAMIVGGRLNGPDGEVNCNYELFDPIGNELTGRKPLGRNPRDYPFLKVLPGGTDGFLFMHAWKKSGIRSLATDTWVDGTYYPEHDGARTYDRQGTAVLLPLRPGTMDWPQVLMVGGQGEDGAATDVAEIFYFNTLEPVKSGWSRTGRTNFKRFMSDGVLLPDGTVLLVNGAARGHADKSADSVKHAELFIPETGSWRALAPASRARHYHSLALLLPDARVLVTGNTKDYNSNNPLNDKTIEIFTPPYLFLGPRPVIDSAPSVVGYGEQFRVGTNDGLYSDGRGGIRQPQKIQSVVLVRASSVTHSNNMDQRLVGLEFKPDGASLQVRAPANGAIAPPGPYMLFLVSQNGVPSIARFVRVRAT